jgi:hypothetical protein
MRSRCCEHADSSQRGSSRSGRQALSGQGRPFACPPPRGDNRPAGSSQGPGGRNAPRPHEEGERQLGVHDNVRDTVLCRLRTGPGSDCRQPRPCRSGGRRGHHRSRGPWHYPRRLLPPDECRHRRTAGRGVRRVLRRPHGSAGDSRCVRDQAARPAGTAAGLVVLGLRTRCPWRGTGGRRARTGQSRTTPRPMRPRSWKSTRSAAAGH